jgi:hypothetical protein
MGIVHFLAMFWIERRDHLKDGFIGGKNPLIARHGCRNDMLTDESSIGGGDDLADIFWKGKQRNDTAEVGHATSYQRLGTADPISL